MGVNGSPELPEESDDSLQFNNVHITNYGPNTSDESDAEEGNVYDGYEPLPVTDIREADQENMDAIISSPPAENLSDLVSSDIEITREVWSEPRPRELEIELDNTRTQQIIAAMAKVTLPNLAIPSWAQDVPEEKWKEDLLERIRQRRDKNKNDERAGSI